MKKLIAAALLFAASFSFFAFSSTAKAAQPAVPANATLFGGVVDVDALPSEVPLPDGAVVIFIRKVPLVGSNVTIAPSSASAGSTMQLVPVNVNGLISQLARPGYQVISAYKAVGSGSAGMDITHTVVSPSAQPQTETIKVTVGPGCYKTTLVIQDLKGNLLKAPNVTCN